MTPLTLLRPPVARERRPAEPARPRTRPANRQRVAPQRALPLFDDAPVAPAVPAAPASPDARPSAPAPADATVVPSDLGDVPTLDELIVGAWEGLLAHETVPCPACGGALAPRYGAGPGPVGGRCQDCRTTIA